MVVKPTHPVAGRVQPGRKLRGRNLRTVCGPAYTDSLDPLRSRDLGRKRQRALREHALGVAALEAFVAPLWQVHQAVFGVLAMESEQVDPRL